MLAMLRRHRQGREEVLYARSRDRRDQGVAAAKTGADAAGPDHGRRELGRAPSRRYRRITIKIGSAPLVDGEDRQGAARLAAGPRRGPRRAARPAQGRGRGRLSGAIALGRRLLGLPESALLARAEPGRRQRRPDRAEPGLGETVLAPHRLITGQILLTPNITEERRRYLNAAHHDRDPARPRRHPDHQRERLRRHRRDPLRRQRPAGGPGRHHDRGRLPGAALRRRRALHRARRQGSRGAAPGARRRDHARRSRRWPAAPPSHLSRGGMTTKIEAGKIATHAGTAMIIANGTDRPAAAALADGARLHPVRPAADPQPGAQALDHGTLKPRGAGPRRCRRGRGAARGKSLLPIGVTALKGDFVRGDAGRDPRPGRPRDRARPRRARCEEADWSRARIRSAIERAARASGRGGDWSTATIWWC